MPDLDEKILDLKRDGKSLREIGAVLQISHEAVRKRLNALMRKDHVSTPTENKRLTALAIENEGVSTASNARKSRTCEKSEVVVNRVSTKNAPSQTTTEGGNLSGDSLESATDPFKPSVEGVSRGSPGIEDLAGAIKGFLEANGIELYREQCEPEAYQVKHNGQTIRLYVQRKSWSDTGSPKNQEETT
jgi:hypothetical protein